MIKRIFYIAIFFVGISYAALGQQSGLDILTIGPNTKALGLNEAVTAELLGASNLYTNPANLVLEDHSTLNAAYTLWIGDLNHTHAGVNIKKESQAFAFGFLGSEVDDIPQRGNQPGPPNGSFSVSSLALSGGYARKLGPVALGATIQYLREQYYIYSASGFAFNFGASTLLWDDRLRLGTSLVNVGEMDNLRNESTTLPTSFRAGYDIELFTFTPPENEELPITVNLKHDLVVPMQSQSGTTQGNATDNTYTNIALEFNIMNIMNLRTGYKTGDTVRHWSAGAGFTIGSFTANYALIPFETGFGTAHSIGLQYRF